MVSLNYQDDNNETILNYFSNYRIQQDVEFINNNIHRENIEFLYFNELSDDDMILLQFYVFSIFAYIVYLIM